jgi:hypothetical protein
VKLGELRPGEHVATQTGRAVVASLTPRPGAIRTYNLAVEGDHRYLVSAAGVVVHNALPCNTNAKGEFVTEINRNGQRMRVEFTGAQARMKTFTVQDPAVREALRAEFDAANGVRKQFLQSLASDPAKVAQLQGKGLTSSDIARLAEGKPPLGYQVDHKTPLNVGGDNSFDNLVLTKLDPYHYALNSIQRWTDALVPGDRVYTVWPEITGFFYNGR